MLQVGALMYYGVIKLFLFLKPDITEGPVSVSVLIGTDAQFHCAGTGVVITWEVDGLASTDPNITSRGITSDDVSSSGTVQSTLTVPATSVNNRTSVRCRLFSWSGSVFSNNSILTVLPGNFMCYYSLAIPIVVYSAPHNAIIYKNVLQITM